MPPNQEMLDQIRPTDSFLLCHPRSGSRWLRNLLVDLVNRYEGIDASLEWIKQRELLGSKHQAYHGYKATEVVSNFVKKTARPESVPAALGGGIIYRGHHLTHILERCGPVVYPFRWPPAVLLSYYHYAMEKGEVTADTPMDVFFRNRVWHLLAHLRTILKAHAADPMRIQLVEYRQVGGPFVAVQLLRCARHWNVHATGETAAAAVSSLATIFNQLNSSGNFGHSRGSDESAVDLPTALLEEIDSITGEAYRAAMAIATAQDEAFRFRENARFPAPPLDPPAENHSLVSPWKC